MSKKLRVGMIGLGGIAVEHHLPYWQSSPLTEIAAVCDSDRERLDAVSAKFGVAQRYEDWHELVSRSDIDIVDIATPNEFHAPIAIEALDLAKHVLCEKPMATSVVDAERMLEKSRERDRKLMINHHFRFHPMFVGLRALTRERGIGRPYHAHCKWLRRRRVPASPTFLRQSLSGGGPMLDLGIHIIDLALCLMGYPKPKSVSGTVTTALGRRDGLGGDWGNWKPDEFEVEDFGNGLFRFEDGATLFIETSWLGFHETAEEWSVHVLGTEAGLHWPAGLYVEEREGVPRSIQLTMPNSVSPYQQSIYRFAEAVANNTPVPIPPEESLQAVRMMESVYVSARAGREVPIG